jgi:hypothetical protein
VTLGGWVWSWRRRTVVVGALIAALGGLAVADGNIAEQRRLASFGASALARADTWYWHGPLYSQDHCYRTGLGYQPTNWAAELGGCHQPYYRTDCSGFVSMAWNLPHSYATPRPGDSQDLGDVTRVIDKDALAAGDALVAPGQHVRLFERWTDRSRTRYWAYDFGSTPVKHQVYRWGSGDDHQYTPVRYIHAT